MIPISWQSRSLIMKRAALVVAFCTLLAHGQTAKPKLKKPVEAPVVVKSSPAEMVPDAKALVQKGRELQTSSRSDSDDQKVREFYLTAADMGDHDAELLLGA